MADELSPAVRVLQEKLEEHLQVVLDTKRTINMLLKMSGQPLMYPETESEHTGAVRADQFYGKGLATCVAEYLMMRKQALLPKDILRGLEAGGFDFDISNWKPEDRLRHLASSLAKNTGGAGKFHKLKNGTFGLRSWYDEDFLKKVSNASSNKKRKAKPAATKAPHQTKLAKTAANKPKVVSLKTEKPQSQPEVKAS